MRYFLTIFTNKDEGFSLPNDLDEIKNIFEGSNEVDYFHGMVSSNGSGQLFYAFEQEVSPVTNFVINEDSVSLVITVMQGAMSSDKPWRAVVRATCKDGIWSGTMQGEGDTCYAWLYIQDIATGRAVSA